MLNSNSALSEGEKCFEDRGDRASVAAASSDISTTFGFDWRRLRIQLGGGLLVAVGLPTLAAIPIFPAGMQSAPMHNSLIACFVAILAGSWLLRSLSTYPGIQASAHILPAFVFSFGGVLASVILGRLGYNRFILFTSFAACIVWFNLVNIMIARRGAMRIGVVPFGDTSSLRSLPQITAIALDRTDASLAIDAVVADLRTDLPNNWDRFLADCALAGIPVFHSKNLIESMTGRVELEHLSENSFGSLSPMGAYMTAKHALDRLAALVSIITLSPLLIALAVVIRIDSPGSAIFRQTRTGYRGKPFTVLKFRSMHQRPDVVSLSDAMTKPSDGRVTRFGRFLRRSRLDELPQLFNVLRGEMSLIGPRPEAEVLSRWYESGIPFYRYRHIVRPGITGWAQVNQGHVAELDDVKTKLHYDFYYIKNYSPWLDLLIVARTMRTMVTGFGSR